MYCLSDNDVVDTVVFRNNLEFYAINNISHTEFKLRCVECISNMHCSNGKMCNNNVCVECILNDDIYQTCNRTDDNCDIKCVKGKCVSGNKNCSLHNDTCHKLTGMCMKEYQEQVYMSINVPSMMFMFLCLIAGCTHADSIEEKKK